VWHFVQVRFQGHLTAGDIVRPSLLLPGVFPCTAQHTVILGVSVVTNISCDESIMLLPGYGVVSIDVYSGVETRLFAKHIVRSDSL
jgi:hypothetical protein